MLAATRPEFLVREMPTPTGRLIAGVPERFFICTIIMLGLMLFLTVDQMHWWKLKPDYAFGWLVPIFVGYVLYERWKPLSQILTTETCSQPRKSLAIFGSLLAGIGLTFGLLLILLGAAYRSQSGPSQPGSLALAMGFCATALGMIYLNTPDGQIRPSGTAWFGELSANKKLRVTAMFLFPACIWMLSAPLVTAVENSISLFLLRKIVSVVFFVFNNLGYTLVQEGNVLILPLGRVGVAEACSGIRSLTGCLFAGSFLAAIMMDKLWKKLLLIACALLLAIFTNLLRSLFLTSWAYAYGSEAIEGDLHDTTGLAVLGLTILGLFCLLPFFKGENWRKWIRIGDAK